MNIRQGQNTGLVTVGMLLMLNACTSAGGVSKPWTMPETISSELSEGEAAYPARPIAEYSNAPIDIKVPAETEVYVFLALEHNPSIIAAESRQREAIANKSAADAGLMPKVTLGARSTRTRTRNENTSSGSSTSQFTRGSLGLSIPIDVFGKLSSSMEAAAFKVVQSTAELDNTRLDVMRDVVVGAVDAAEQSLLLALNEKQLQTNRTSYKLTELRFTKGRANIVDVLQQRDLVASLEQEVPGLIAGRINALDTLAIVTGHLPGSVEQSAFTELFDLSAVSNLISPEGLLDSRPDMRALKAGLDAADSRLSAAIKDRLPSFEFSSSALATLVSGDISSVISGTLSAAFTLFDGGAKRAVVSARRATLEQTGAIFIEAWLRAVVEVDGFLAEEKRRADEYRLAEARLENARKLHSAAERRYRLGASDYLPVLNAMRTIHQQERSLLSLQANLLRARVRLHTAMGGKIHVSNRQLSGSKVAGTAS